MTDPMTSPLSVEEVCKRLQVVIDGLNTLHMHEDWPSNAQCEMWSDHIEQAASLLESLSAIKAECKEALGPFAALSKMLPDEEPDNTTFVNTVIDQRSAKSITSRYAASALRRAAALHSKISGKE